MREGELKLAGLCGGPKDVQLAVLGISNGAILRYRDVADGIFGVMGDLLFAGGVAYAGAPQVDGGAALLREVIIGVSVCAEDGLTVLSLVRAELGELAVLQEPNVARYGRGVMLAERVLIALIILVKYCSVGPYAELGHCDAGEQLRALLLASGRPDLGVSGELAVGRVCLKGGGEGYAAVWQNGLGRF